MQEYFLLFFNSDTHWIRGWDDSTGGLASLARRKIPSRALVIQAVANLFTD
jgi:hypothetical protein